MMKMNNNMFMDVFFNDFTTFFPDFFVNSDYLFKKSRINVTIHQKCWFSKMGLYKTLQKSNIAIYSYIFSFEVYQIN